MGNLLFRIFKDEDKKEKETEDNELLYEMSRFFEERKKDEEKASTKFCGPLEDLFYNLI